MSNTQETQQQPSVETTAKQAYNPLMDNVNEKPYSVQSVQVSQEQMSSYIPEPLYQPQAIGGRDNPYERIKEQSGTASNSSGGGSSSAPPPINPSLKQMPDAEKKQAAKYMATLVMDIYEQGHVWVNKTLPISQRKLQSLENEGVIDLSLAIRDGFGNVTTAGEYIQEYNNEVSTAFSVDPKWKKETMPILEEVLAKRGAAMTPEQMLLIQFGKDIGMKALQFMQIKKAQKEMIDLLKDIKEQNGGGGASYVPTQKTDAKTENDETVSPYAYAPQEPINEDRFNFETNETVMASTVEQMRVPTTGKARAIAQRQKEKKWKKDADEADSSYEKAMADRKTGKRGRRKSVVDYVKAVDKDEIVDALILSETKNEDKK